MNFNQNEFLTNGCTGETISEHHLGQTIVKEANARQLNITMSPENGEVIKGNGIRAKIEEHILLLVTAS